MRPTSVLATVTGRDRPGVTASFFAALAAHDVDVRDVEQVVIRDRLILTVRCAGHGDTATLRNSVSRAASALGMDCEIAVGEDSSAELSIEARGSRVHVIILGHPLRPGAVGHVAQRIADAGGNIETVTQLSTHPVTALEMVVRSPDVAGLRAVLVRAAEDTGVDIAVEPAGLSRRAKRLVLLDLDSTLMQDAVVEVLAERAGVAHQVREITARTTAGELDFAASLRERVSLVAGLPESALADVRNELELGTSAAIFVRTLRRLGYRVGLVSAGFTAVISHLASQLDLDFAAANELEVVDGVITGRLLGPVVDGAGKADALARFAEQFGVPMTQTVAVGDGTNDVEMLERAGLGVALNAKAALRASADGHASYLESVLFVLGVTREEIAEAASN